MSCAASEAPKVQQHKDPDNRRCGGVGAQRQAVHHNRGPSPTCAACFPVVQKRKHCRQSQHSGHDFSDRAEPGHRLDMREVQPEHRDHAHTNPGTAGETSRQCARERRHRQMPCNQNCVIPPRHANPEQAEQHVDEQGGGRTVVPREGVRRIDSGWVRRRQHRWHRPRRRRVHAIRIQPVEVVGLEVVVKCADVQGGDDHQG